MNNAKHEGTLSVVAAKYVQAAKDAGVAVGGTKETKAQVQKNQEMLDASTT